MNLDIKALAELGKSFARFLYFGILGLIGTFLVSLAANPSLANAHVTIGTTVISVGTLIIAGLAAVAKALDLYVRNSNKNDLNGIAPAFLQK